MILIFISIFLADRFLTLIVLLRACFIHFLINRISNLSDNELILTNIGVISYLPAGRQVRMIRYPIVLVSSHFIPLFTTTFHFNPI